jgi:hypothetical protein
MFRIGLVAAFATLCFSPASADELKSRFDGFYAGATAGYDIPTDKTWTERTWGDYRFVDRGYYVPHVPESAIGGPKLGIVSGYNTTSGSLLFGFEARAQYNFNQTNAATTNAVPGQQLPYLYSAESCNGCEKSFIDNYPNYAPSNYWLSSSETQTVRLSRPWQIDMSIRGGVILQDWLVFGKVGLGMEASRTVSVDDYSASVVCNSPVTMRTRPNAYTVKDYIVGCGSPTTGGQITQTITNSINPTAIFGIGAERNFGNYFARAEAEMTAHLVSGSTYYTPAVNVTAGVRF